MLPFAPDCRQAVCNRMGPVWALPSSAESGKLQLDMQITQRSGCVAGVGGTCHSSSAALIP